MEKLIKKAILKYDEYKSICEKIAREAQKYIDWSDDISCEYYPADGICLCIECDNDFPHVVSVSTFFEMVKKYKKISKEDYMCCSI